VPGDLDALLALPGIGEYTARAVAVFAFGQRHPVVDTNVRRVLARHQLGVGLPAGTSTTARDRAFVAELLPGSTTDAVRTSVALMELGALVCVARQPHCNACPIATDCSWRLAGAPEATPARRQLYEGTDRQARGRLLAIVRESAEPVAEAALTAAWPKAAQRRRALAGLLADGLVTARADGRYALPA
jgi:A/G-specific adenine glycosylase